jgi:hypothetical protein
LSDAFLRYICRQVKEFSRGVSEKMITNERFFTISSNHKIDTIPETRPLNSHFGLNFKETVLPLARVFAQLDLPPDIHIHSKPSIYWPLGFACMFIYYSLFIRRRMNKKMILNKKHQT